MGPRVMVVWRPSVARMVYLHTSTMGVHRACLLSFEGGSRHPRGPDLAGRLLPCPTHSTCTRAPAGGRQVNLAACRAVDQAATSCFCPRPVLLINISVPAHAVRHYGEFASGKPD